MVVKVLIQLLGVAFAGATLAASVRTRKALRWPTTEGVVIGTNITERRWPRGGFVYNPVVLYRYTIGGVEYQGQCLDFAEDLRRDSHSDAEKFLKSYPVGSGLQVHYDPTTPSESALLPPERSGGLIGWVIASTAVLALMTWLIWWVV